MALTADGRALLAAALPAWREAQAENERILGAADPDRLRVDLRALS